MFGYITPDKPNMYMKDYYLFRAYYCGMCINTKKCGGNCMRLAVNYDLTFVNILLDGVLGNEPKIAKKICILNPFKRKAVVQPSVLGNYMIYLNTLLAEFKLLDDKADKSLSFGKRIAFPLIRRKAKKARKLLPDVARLIDNCLIEQQQAEKELRSIDQISHPFAKLIAEVGIAFVGDKGTEDFYNMLYSLGKWVYLIDAVDDFDEDKKRRNCNVFAFLYPECSTKEVLLAQKSEQIKQLLDNQLDMISKFYQTIVMSSNEGVVTNTLWFGLEARQEQIMTRCKKCQKGIRL